MNVDILRLLMHLIRSIFKVKPFLTKRHQYALEGYIQNMKAGKKEKKSKGLLSEL